MIDPALSFAKVPDPIGETGEPVVILDEKKKKVEMPSWYWQSLVQYILKTEKVRLQYEAWRTIVYEEK